MTTSSDQVPAGLVESQEVMLAEQQNYSATGVVEQGERVTRAGSGYPAGLAATTGGSYTVSGAGGSYSAGGVTASGGSYVTPGGGYAAGTAVAVGGHSQAGGVACGGGGMVSLVEQFGGENVGHDEKGEFLIKRVEVPEYETVTREQRTVERKETVVEKKVPVYQESVKRVECKEVRTVDVYKEVEQVVEKDVYQTKKQVVDRPVEVVVEKKVVQEVVKQQVVEVRGEVVEVPKYYVVERPVEVPHYLDQRVPVVVAQSFYPIIVEADEAEEVFVDVECRLVSFQVQHQNVYVPLTVQRPALFESMVTQHRPLATLPDGQFNALVRQLNPDLDFDYSADLFRFHHGSADTTAAAAAAANQGKFFKTDKGGLYLQNASGCFNVQMKEDRTVVCTLNKTNVPADQLIEQHNAHLQLGHQNSPTYFQPQSSASAAVEKANAFFAAKPTLDSSFYHPKLPLSTSPAPLNQQQQHVHHIHHQQQQQQQHVSNAQVGGPASSSCNSLAARFNEVDDLLLKGGATTALTSSTAAAHHHHSHLQSATGGNQQQQTTTITSQHLERVGSHNAARPPLLSSSGGSEAADSEGTESHLTIDAELGDEHDTAPAPRARTRRRRDKADSPSLVDWVKEHLLAELQRQ